MGWLKSLFKRPDKAHPPELSAAEQKGRDAFNSVAANFDEFFTERFGHIPEAFLALLTKHIDNDIRQTDRPPLLIARAHFAIFQQNVTKAGEIMQSEIAGQMKEWTEVDNALGVDGVTQLTNHEVKNFCSDLTLRGFALLSERVPELKLADDKWRAEFPELAKLEHLEE